MLDSLRGFAKSWPGKIMGGFLLVGIAGFGINNVITDLGTNTVARVGDEEINSREFLRAYQSQMNRVAQQIGSVPIPKSGNPARQRENFELGGSSLSDDQVAAITALGRPDGRLFGGDPNTHEEM